MMNEKRKNSEQRRGLSLFLMLSLVLAGVFIGLLSNSSSDEQSIYVEEFDLSRVDLSGEWIGTTTEDYLAEDATEEQRYDYRIVINQTGRQIDGMGYLDMIDGSDIYAEERIEGAIQNNQLVYSEVETLVLENTTFDSWCLTQTTLTYQVVNDLETLVGEWEYVLDDDRCAGISGRVILTRQTD